MSAGCVVAKVLMISLTHEETRRNWEEYGNPDGPGEKSFGIALPAWLVSEDNKYGILMLYTLLLVVVLPVCVVG